MRTGTSAHLLALTALLAACGGGGGGAPDHLPDEPRPGKRSDVATVADPATGKMVLFGGDNGPIVAQIPMPSYVGDSWVLDPDRGWTQLSGAGPDARGRYAVARSQDGAMLLFGGRSRPAGSGPYTLYSDVWSFDYGAETWSQVADASATGPAPRYFATAAVDSATGDLVIVGGSTSSDPLSLQPVMDAWRFDGNGWSEMVTTGTPPSQRLFMAYTYDSVRNRLVVFGGQVGDFVSPGLSDLHALDLETGEWTELHSGASNAPSGRFSAMLAYDAENDRYWLFGGHADAGVSNELWSFDPTSNTWAQVAGGDTFTGEPLGCGGNAAEIPQNYVVQDLSFPERRSGAAMTVVGHHLYLVGGESDCSDHLDDTWRFDTGTGEWTELLPARTGESCARRGDDCPCLCI